jgi:hypothetical protein
VQYTLWSHGRLLGETDLAFARCLPKHRMGWFHPSDLGERLMPIICGVKPAFFALGELTRRLIPNPYGTGRRSWDVDTVLKNSAEYADLAAAYAQEAGLALELRGPTGVVIPTEDIGIQDTEYLRSLNFDDVSLYDVEAGRTGDVELDAETLAEIEEFVEEFKENTRWVSEADEEKESDLPRYQIQVHLIDEADVP